MSLSLHLEELVYQADSCELFERFADLPGAAFLDSCQGAPRAGRYDIITAQPAKDSPEPLSAQASPAQCQNYFAELGQFQRERYAGIHSAADLPFCGGLLGYLGYDSGMGLQGLAAKEDDEALGLPLASLQAYDWCIVQDHLLRRAVLVSLPTLAAAERQDYLSRARAARTTTASSDFVLNERFSSNLEAAEYREAFERIQSYIRAGDCYQVNLARRYSAPYQGEPWQAYRRLRAVAGAPFSAFLAMAEDSALMSLSPERFIALRGSRVETRPIKGTRPRNMQDPAADRVLAEQLQSSSKDRAENLMIVDLLRNDLGRSCVPGSIRVEQLFAVESYPTVHHLVSTITGELEAERSALDLLRDSFPGGSITGAPKRRAMEIIAELEPHRRQHYCGSVAYISADGRMDSNIAIRSLLCHSGQVLCWAGGGIVADSDCTAEFQETIDKVGQFLNCLEQSLKPVDKH